MKLLKYIYYFLGGLIDEKNCIMYEIRELIEYYHKRALKLSHIKLEK